MFKKEHNKTKYFVKKTIPAMKGPIKFPHSCMQTVNPKEPESLSTPRISEAITALWPTTIPFMYPCITQMVMSNSNVRL